MDAQIKLKGDSAKIISLYSIPKKRHDLLGNVNTFLEWKQVSRATRANYFSCLTRFLSTTTEPYNWLMVQNYINKMFENYADSTASYQANIIKSFYEFLDTRCDLENDVWRKINIRKVKYSGGYKKIIPDEYFKKMYTMFDFSNINEIRDYTVLRILQSTGMRVHEPFLVKIKDIKWITDKDGIKHRVIDSTQKGGHRLVCKLHNGTANAIDNYLSLRGKTNPDDYLFVQHKFKFKETPKPMDVSSFTKKLSELFKSIGLEGYSSHCIRYTAAVRVMMETGDERKASEKLNHISPKTIQYYTKGYREELHAMNDYNIEINF